MVRRPDGPRGVGLPLAHLKKIDGTTYAVYPALRAKRLADAAHPEEPVRMALYNRLLEVYDYPPKRVRIEVPVRIREDEAPRYADVVVYDDDDLRRPLIVGEAKQSNRKTGERQGQRYATILRAVYAIWTNAPNRWTCSVLVNRYPEEAVSIADVPKFGGEPKYEVADLRPFDDDRHLTSTIQKCHNLIRSVDNKRADDAFDEFLKVLFVKFKDESRDHGFECQVLLRGVPPKPEGENETAQRIRALFHHAAVEDADISGVFSEWDDIHLTNASLAGIVKILQPYSFSATQVDQKARAFETFLTGDMRQEFKEFMTPRNVVQAIVGLAAPSVRDHILDPCCGSGAFLVESLRYVRERVQAKALTEHQRVRETFDFAHDHLWGVDSSLQMANVARLNMLVNEDGRAHIFNHDGLVRADDAPPALRGRAFDLIMTNPPFGKRLSRKLPLLRSFLVTGGADVKGGDLLTEVLFLERNLDWLKPNGRMFIVLPDSVLGNRLLAATRQFIEQRARLIAVISLTADTFGPSGARIRRAWWY